MSTSREMTRARIFLVIWTLAVIATVCAFVVHLALRGRTVSLGYELGKARSEQARLREVKRVLELEAASYKTPERVEMVARTLLGMKPPAAGSHRAPSGATSCSSPDERRARARAAQAQAGAGDAVRNLDPDARASGSGSAWASSAG